MKYMAIISKEGDQWLATFPDAPGCFTCADTEEELAAAAAEALEGWLESMLESGNAPSRPMTYAVSGKLHVGKTLRSEHPELPAELHYDPPAHIEVTVPPAIAVALQLRWARIAAGLTQGQLADRIGVSQQRIANLEKPGSNPKIGTIHEVAVALGVQLNVLVA